MFSSFQQQSPPVKQQQHPSSIYRHQREDSGRVSNSQYHSTEDFEQSDNPLGILSSKLFTFNKYSGLSQPQNLERPELVAQTYAPDQIKPLIDFVPSYRDQRQASVGSVSEAMAPLSGRRESAPSRTGEKSKSGLSGWLSGATANATHADGFTPKEVTKSTSTCTLTSPPSPKASLRSIPTASSTATAPSATGIAARFGGLFTKAAPVKPLPASFSDELLTLSIPAALFPGGALQEGETFSPAAFKNLQMIAEGLLTRMQEAYKSRTMEYHDLKSEYSAQNDECEEATTRAEHLKLQLEGMSRQVEEHDSQMAQLRAELQREKDAREAERKAYRHTSSPTADEDLLDPERVRGRTWRKSDSSFDYEEDERSVVDSVFSRNLSPANTDRSSLPSPSLETGEDKMSPLPAITQSRPRVEKQQGAFERITGARSNTAAVVSQSATTSPTAGNNKLVAECSNCRGGTEAMAWANIAIYKAHIIEQDRAIEDALDIIKYGI